jgi:molybdopterin synthase sulfur carrier subunit
MKIRVRYFAAVREQLGAGQEIEVPPGATVGEVRQALRALSPRHADALRRELHVRAALDHVLCDDRAVATDGCEVAFFPPVTGG